MATRRERVVVSLDDDYSGPMGRCVGATALLNAELDRLSGQAVMTSRFARTVERDMDGVASSTKRADTSINQLSGRLSILARLAAVLGPGLVPVSAVAVAGVAGLASQLGFAAAGGLSLVVALQGAGDAIKAVEAARLDPTVANLEKAEEAMAKLAPEAREFVDRVQEIRPVLAELQKSAAAGWFPGLTDALDSIETAAPTIERILLAVSTAGGDLIADGAESLAGERWADFLEFIETEAPDAITALGQAVGSLTHGLASLWMAMDPVNDGVRDWLVDVTKSFDDWASSLDEGDVQGFFDYLSEMGPKVAATAGAIANAILQIAEAAAPIGGPVLDGLTAVANVLAFIADSPLGTPIMAAVAALSAMSLAARGADAAMTGIRNNVDALGGSGASGLNRMAATLLTIAGSASLIQTAFEQIAGTRIDSGTLQRDLEALADGRLTKNFDDLYHTFRDIDDLWMAKANPIGWISSWDPTGAEAAEKNIKDIDSALAGLVESGNAEQAAQAWDELQAIGKDAGKSTKELVKLFPQYSTAVENAAEASDHIASSSDRAAVQQGFLRSRLVAARDAARESGKAFISFADSISGEKFSMSGWLEAFEAQVTALAEFRDNLQDLREDGLDPEIIAELEKQGPAAAQAVAGLAKGGAENIERLNAAARTAGKEVRGMGQDAKNAERGFQALGDKKIAPKVDLNDVRFNNKRAAVDADLDRTNKKTAKPKADLNDKAFKSGIRSMKSELTGATRMGAKPKVDLIGVPSAEAQLQSLTKARTAWVTIQTIFGGGGDGPGQKDGGTIPRAATGTTVPDDGRGYRDYLLYRLAPLEEVISNGRGQADEFRAELKDINRGMSRSEVAERMLARGLAGGGTAGGDPSWVSSLAQQAQGSKAKVDKSWLPVGLIELFELPKTLKGLNKALKQSEKALDREKNARDEIVSKMSALHDAVAGKATSDLFGETDVWTAGGSFSDVMAVLAGDIATGTRMQADIASLQKKGLGGTALDALLAQADAATISTFAGLSAAQLDQFEKQFERRASVANTAGKSASSAVYAADKAAADARVKRVEAKLDRIEKAIKAEHKADRESRNRGNSKGNRGRKGGNK